MSLRPSRKSSYLKIIGAILLSYKKELQVAVLTSSREITGVGNLDRVLENATDEERTYLVEAVGCARSGYLRASTVLGWNAAVDRLHRVIEKLGFEEFNKKSEEMKAIQEGRFKPFKKVFSVNSISELRATVFDTDLLWILEYWQLIDKNEHDRLQLCFTMRSNCAHPGEAPLTRENLASFYSDLKEIVFDNSKFALASSVKSE